MLFGQRLLPLYSIVASKGPKRRMKRRRESASVQTYSSPREYKVNRPPLQCSGTNLAFLSLSPSSSSTETAFCALLSSALALFLPLPLSPPPLSLSLLFSSFPFFSFFTPRTNLFYWPSCLAFSPLDPSPGVHACTHARTHAPPDYATEFTLV